MVVYILRLDTSNFMFKQRHLPVFVCLLKMETTIKHAEEERCKAVDSARNLYEEMQLLKEEVDVVRSNIGLERLPDNEANNKIVQK